MRRFLIGLLVAALAPVAGMAQQSALDTRDPRQSQDAEFARLVKEWTTKPEFMSPLVDHLPVADGVPTPKAILGHHIGQPKTLTYYADILRYYRALDAASPRVSIESIGTTDEGREMIVVYISDEAGIRDLQTHKDGYATLADPRKASDEQIRTVIAATKPMYQMMGGLHSGETGPSEMLMELAYRLTVETSPLITEIRDNVIVAITPVADADGRDRYVDWYYRHLVDYDTETGRPGGPPYWGKYVFHDNNRDINFSQVSMRNLLEWYLRTHPPIMHDLHESIPFLYTYSGQAPQNPNLDPILFAELPMFANFEMAQMIKYGMPGVWTHGFMDGWSPGYLGSMSYNHNGLMRMYETFGNGGANTMTRRIGGARGGPGENAGEGGRAGGGGHTSREWYRPLPPYSDVVWSMRNNTNYMQTAVLSGLQFTARFPKVILENFYRKTVNSIEDGKKTAPHAFVIPGGQKDQTRVARLVNLLRLQGVEVGLAASPVKVKDRTWPAGSYVIKRDQPYGRLAKILLETQDYPDPALRTYDDSGWTMGHMLHTEVIAVDDSSILDVPVALVSTVVLKGRVGGSGGAALAVAHFGSNNMVTLRHRLKALAVKTTEKAFTAGGVEHPAGSFVIPAAGNDLAKARAEIEALGLTATALDRMPGVAMHDADLPRIAMFSTWTSTQEVGWVRHAFDQFEIPFDLIYKERVKDGNLRRDYDVILMPSQGGSGRAFVHGPDGTKPIAYTKTEQFTFLGAYGSSEDIRGGFGLEGVLEFQKFLDGGGVLITLGAASFFPAEFGLARNLSAERPSNQFYAPRPIVNGEIMRADHPIFYGYDKKLVPTKYTNGPLLTVSGPGAQGAVLMRYPGGDDNVLSGLMRGANEVRNRAAIVDIPNGQGRVLVYATNPVYRWQNHGEFNMLFNALLNWNDIKTAPPAAQTEAPVTGP